MRGRDACVGAVVRHGSAHVVVWAMAPAPGARWVIPVGGGREAYEVRVRELEPLAGAGRLVAGAR